MNINFGLFLGPEIRIRDKKKRNQYIVDRAFEMQEKWLGSLERVK
jgi:folate-dependent tRNA-U54 methylase TrmFO/GidA